MGKSMMKGGISCTSLGTSERADFCQLAMFDQYRVINTIDKM